MATASRLTQPKFTYLDVNGLPQSVNDVLVSDIDAINMQMYMLFLTYIGEADYEPTLGSGMDNYLFDPNYKGTHDLLQTVLYNAVARWMSDRIVVRLGDVVILDVQDSKVRITVTYTYKRLNVQVRTVMDLQAGG